MTKVWVPKEGADVGAQLSTKGGIFEDSLAEPAPAEDDVVRIVNLSEASPSEMDEQPDAATLADDSELTVTRSPTKSSHRVAKVATNDMEVRLPNGVVIAVKQADSLNMLIGLIDQFGVKGMSA